MAIEKQHGNKGNLNALKDSDETAESNLTARVKTNDKSRWVKMAGRSNDTKGLTAWVIKVLNEAVDEDLKK